jgi:hypothetical protein
MPQNRCYRNGHRKGGSVTERGRREYPDAVGARYRIASKKEQGRIDPQPWVAIPSGLDGRRIVGDAGFAMASEPERKRR